MFRSLVLVTCSLAALVPSTAAQTSFPESEPNSAKADADVVSGIVSGDTITGTSTGGATGIGLATVDTADYFDVRLPPVPAGIYCYSLSLATSPLVDLSIRGLSQTSGSVNVGTDVSKQSDPAGGSPNTEDRWYGFGNGERLYVKVVGSSVTTASYTMTYVCQPLTPATTTAFQAGPLTITTIGQGHSTNTEIQIYDSSYVPVVGGHNDDYLPGSTTQSRVDVTLTAGTYYLAIGDFNTSTNLSDASATEGNQNGNVLDFPDLIVNGSVAGSTGSPIDLSYTISDGTTVFPVTASKTARYEIHFATFTVDSPVQAFCLGDGSGTACPCANFGIAPHGCANASFSNGGQLSNSGLASVSVDTLVLTASEIPGPGLFFQGTTPAAGGAGIAFGDGLLCASGTITRMGLVFPTAGSASYPGGLTPNPISVAGAPLNPSDVRHYQCWYRDAAPFCSPSTFNLTNGVTVTWVP